MTAWVVRGGLRGEHEPWNLENNKATVGWPEIGDLAPCKSREDVRALIDEAFPGGKAMRNANHTGQLWAFRTSIKLGDLVIMPLKTRPGYLAFGRCTGEYAYDPQSGDSGRRHTIPVEWREDPVAKTAIKDDLLFTLNAIMTVFSPSRNNATERLEAVYRTSSDPGSERAAARAGAATPVGAAEQSPPEDSNDVVDPATGPSLDAIRDRIRTFLVENFAGHKLTRLVAEILEVLGFVCEVSSSGPDGGVDILAGRGPLGLDSPTLIVEVKSQPTPVKSEVVRGLHSAINQHNADQGLLVAWGGVSDPARREFSTQRTRLQIWDAERLLEKLFQTYDKLSIETQQTLPLKQAWVLNDEEP